MKSEAAVQQEIRLAASRNGVALMRNNVGAATDNTGRLVRYGLGNESAKINAVRKSSDLIGIKTVTITPDMVGRQIGIFTAVEVKREGWTGPSNDREIAQQNFGNWVIERGGLFQFAASVEDVRLW